ncbi:MAG: hypothetical protein LKJ90_00255 [Faecalibacterium sp.]|jgi:hypothetical protein|nr:hypothetical protein [Faecalibacterium sp.]
MKKQIKRIAAALMATGMLLCAMPIAAFATDDLVGYYPGKPTPAPQDKDPYQQDEEYVGCTSTKAELKKYLQLGVKNPIDTDIPYAKCSFEISAVDPNAQIHYPAGWTATKGVFETAGKTKDALPDVEFGPNNGTISDQKAVQSFSYDFKNVLDANKYQSGYVYCYKITETGCTPNYIESNNDVRYVDVYVGTNKGAEESILKVIVYRLVESWGKVTAYKNNDFCNEYCTTTLDLTKLITGNQCKKDKKFDFKVIIDTKVSGGKMTGYTMYITNKYGNSTLTPPMALTVGADGTAMRTGTMTDKDHVQITNIPAGATYNITETLDGYVLTVTDNGKPASLNKDKNGCSGKIDENDLVFTNTKNGNIPTGVALDVAPYALMVGLALAGIVVFSVRKRRAQ